MLPPEFPHHNRHVIVLSLACLPRRACQQLMYEKTLPVVPSSWEEGLGVVENNNVITYYSQNILISRTLLVASPVTALPSSLPPRASPPPTPPSRRRLGSLELPPVWLRPHQGERIPHSRRRTGQQIASSLSVLCSTASPFVPSNR